MKKKTELWSRENSVKLIKLYESHRLLWDKFDKKYIHQLCRKAAYDDIARELEIYEVKEIRRKIRSILAQFRRERKIILSDAKLAERKSPWWGLEHLQFLKKSSVQTFPATSPSASTSSSSTPCASANMGGPSSTNPKALEKRADEALSLVTTSFIPSTTSETTSLSRDEHSVYGETVANRLRKITNPLTRCIVKNKIDNLIFQAEMEGFQDHMQSSFS